MKEINFDNDFDYSGSNDPKILEEYGYGRLLFIDENVLSYAKDIARLIIENEVKTNEIAPILKDICSDLAHDVVVFLNKARHLNFNEFQDVEQDLRQLYLNEYEEQSKNGVFKGRLEFKTNKNKRLITKDELAVIFSSKDPKRHTVFNPDCFEENSELWFLAKSAISLSKGKKYQKLKDLFIKSLDEQLLSIKNKIEEFARPEI